MQKSSRTCTNQKQEKRKDRRPPQGGLLYYVGNIVYDIDGISTKSTSVRESAKPTLFFGRDPGLTAGSMCVNVKQYQVEQ